MSKKNKNRMPIPVEQPSQPEKPIEQSPYAGRGIVIIALGNSNYGRMAANLASSLRFHDRGISIHLVHTAESVAHLSDKHKQLFTSMAECPPEHYTKNGKTAYIKAKTCVYELSPFEETILLDADMLWFSDSTGKNATSLFDSLKGVDLTFQNRGFFDLSNEVIDEKYANWCNIKEVKEKYFTGAIEKDKGRFYHLHSELIYFIRSESNKAFFDLARKIFDNPLVKPADFDGDIPDELAFDIAVAVTGKNPHQLNYLPIFWFATVRHLGMQEMLKNYYGMSMGGNNLPPYIKERYHDISKFYAKSLGLPNYFQITSKKKWSAHRGNI